MESDFTLFEVPEQLDVYTKHKITLIFLTQPPAVKTKSDFPYCFKNSVLIENLRYGKAIEKTVHYSQFPRGGSTPSHGGEHARVGQQAEEDGAIV